MSTLNMVTFLRTRREAMSDTAVYASDIPAQAGERAVGRTGIKPSRFGVVSQFGV